MNINHHLLPGRFECKCAVFKCSRDRDLGRDRLVEDTTLCGPPWNDPAYEARDILSDAAASDVLDCLNSVHENKSFAISNEVDLNHLATYQVVN